METSRTASFFDAYAKDFNAIYGNETRWSTAWPTAVS
jgi:hypothetical protein